MCRVYTLGRPLSLGSCFVFYFLSAGGGSAVWMESESDPPLPGFWAQDIHLFLKVSSKKIGFKFLSLDIQLQFVWLLSRLERLYQLKIRKKSKGYSNLDLIFPFLFWILKETCVLVRAQPRKKRRALVLQSATWWHAVGGRPENKNFFFLPAGTTIQNSEEKGQEVIWKRGG